MNIHMQECPENVHTCPFLPFGCYYRGSAADIAKHEDDKIHLKLMLYELLKLKNEQSNICNTTTLKDNTVQQIESYFNMKTVQDDLQKQIEKQKLEIDWCKKRIFELEHQYDLEQTVEYKITNDGFTELKQQLDDTKSSINSEYKTINDGFIELKEQLASTNKSIDKDSKVLNDKCEKLNEQLEDMELSLDGTDQKLQNIISKNNQLKQSLDNTTLNLRKSIEKLELVNAQSIKTEKKTEKKNDEERKIINEQLSNLKTSFAENKKILSDEIGGVAESLNALSVKQDECANQFGTLKEMIIQQAAKIPARRSNYRTLNQSPYLHYNYFCPK